jgi:hypothetical protein
MAAREDILTAIRERRPASRPSGSADIGGKTVHPAQGVTTLTVIFSPQGHPRSDGGP